MEAVGQAAGASSSNGLCQFNLGITWHPCGGEQTNNCTQVAEQTQTDCYICHMHSHAINYSSYLNLMIFWVHGNKLIDQQHTENNTELSIHSQKFLCDMEHPYISYTMGTRQNSTATQHLRKKSDTYTSALFKIALWFPYKELCKTLWQSLRFADSSLVLQGAPRADRYKWSYGAPINGIIYGEMGF